MPKRIKDITKINAEKVFGIEKEEEQLKKLEELVSGEIDIKVLRMENKRLKEQIKK